MTDLRLAATRALEALENVTHHFTRTPSTLKDSEVRGDAHKSIEALRAALAQPADVEPVAWMDPETKVLYDHDTSEVDKFHGFAPTVPLYTHPPARVPLTDEQARDAKRYRWLRHALSDNGPNGKSHWFCSISAGHPEELDSALDAAMKGGEA